MFAFADCTKEPEKFRSNWEVGISNMMIYSQEYMRYFFADDSSDIRPLPASGLSLFAAKDYSEHLRLIQAFTLPLREEEVSRRTGGDFRYYYPKLLISGIETDFYTGAMKNSQSCIRVSGLAGLSLPLGKRFLKYAPPIVILRTGIGVGPNTFLNVGFGYSGNIATGAWFLPFGVTYQLREI